MSYALGIDLGTTYSAAAIYRQGVTEMVSLGYRATIVPSAVFLTSDGEFLLGDAAIRRGVAEPERVVREFKRRIGDSVPLIVGGSPLSAEAVMARLLRWMVDTVVEQQGEPPDRIGLTYPANWGLFKQERLAQVIRLAELSRRVVTLTEPDAAAIAYAHAERVAPGEVIAVYDLGGGTFDAAVLRKTATGFELLGEPEGIERLGGIDIDEAVFAHVNRALGAIIDDVPLDDPVTARALARLRQDCVEAKEALSSDTDVSIPVVLPHLSTEVRLTRSELEGMVRPLLDDTVGALRRAVTSAGLTYQDIDRVLLVGGSSRIPFVGQLVSESLGRPYFVDAHPKHAVALGAARMIGEAWTTAIVPAVEEVLPEPPEPAPKRPISVEPLGAGSQEQPKPNGAWRLRQRRRITTVVAAVLACAVVALGIRTLLEGNGDGDGDGGNGQTESTEPTEPSVPTIALGEATPVGRFPDGLAVDDDDRLWVTSTFANDDGVDDLARIDVTTGTVEDTFRVGGEPIGVVVAEGSVWVARRAADQVVRLDPETGQEIAVVEAPGRPHDLAFGAGALWVASAEGVLTRIDPADNTARVVRDDLSELSGLVATDDAVWVAYGTDPGTVAALDPDTGETFDEVSVAGDVDELARAESGLWVTRRDGTTVHRIDPDTLAVTDVTVGAAPSGIAVDGDRIWVVNNEDGSVTLIDGPSATVLDTIEIGEKPLGLITTPDRVWVSLSGENAVARLDVSAPAA